MTSQPHWLALAAVPALAVLHASATLAFTDANAELKEAAAERAAQPVAASPVQPPARTSTAWVPVSPKALDGFRPVFADERLALARPRAAVLARASAPASAAR